MTNTTCKTCRFSKAYPMPEGECPPETEPPDGRYLEAYSIWHVLEGPRRDWLNAERRSQTEVRCHRFPDSMDKLKTDWCGEYQARGKT